MSESNEFDLSLNQNYAHAGACTRDPTGDSFYSRQRLIPRIIIGTVRISPDGEIIDKVEKK